MPLPVHPTWYDTADLGDGLLRVREPFVRPLLAANTWVVKGRDRNLFVDCGLGVTSIRAGLPDLFDREPTLVLTHGHLDHMGSAHEFAQVWAHRAERVDRAGRGSLDPGVLSAVLGAPEHAFGDEPLLDGVPVAGYDPAAYELQPVQPTRELADGDTVDLGDSVWTVLHLPGHTPGSIGLYEPEQRVLFTGDVIYDDDEMIDFLTESSVADYRHSMRRLLDLDVEIVHAGHGDSFGPERLTELADRYLTCHSH